MPKLKKRWTMSFTVWHACLTEDRQQQSVCGGRCAPEMQYGLREFCIGMVQLRQSDLVRGH